MDCGLTTFSNSNVSTFRPAKKSLWDKNVPNGKREPLKQMTTVKMMLQLKPKVDKESIDPKDFNVLPEKNLFSNDDSSSWIGSHRGDSHDQDEALMEMTTKKIKLKLKPKNESGNFYQKKNNNALYKKVLPLKPRKERQQYNPQKLFSLNESPKSQRSMNITKTMLPLRGPHITNNDSSGFVGSDGCDRVASDDEYFQFSSPPPPVGLCPSPPGVRSPFGDVLEKKCHACFATLAMIGCDPITDPILVPLWYGHDTLDAAGNVICPMMLQQRFPSQPIVNDHSERFTVPPTANPWQNWATWLKAGV